MTSIPNRLAQTAQTEPATLHPTVSDSFSLGIGVSREPLLTPPFCYKSPGNLIGKNGGNLLVYGFPLTKPTVDPLDLKIGDNGLIEHGE